MTDEQRERYNAYHRKYRREHLEERRKYDREYHRAYRASGFLKPEPPPQKEEPSDG